jgi:hypothetical protein
MKIAYVKYGFFCVNIFEKRAYFFISRIVFAHLLHFSYYFIAVNYQLFTGIK